jgi:hypothetical protein
MAQIDADCQFLPEECPAGKADNRRKQIIVLAQVFIKGSKNRDEPITRF